MVDANGLPLHFAITSVQQHDSLAARALLEGLPSGGMVLAGKAYDATEITNGREFTWRLGEHPAPSEPA